MLSVIVRIILMKNGGLSVVPYILLEMKMYRNQ
jgi:hypothetical protein